MQPRQCWECGRWVEPPYVITSRGFVDCQDCIEAQRASKLWFEEILPDIESGILCAMCEEEMNPPGGFAVPTVDGTRLMRLCATCRQHVESRRKKS
jgi:hypothetical protein